MSRPVVVLGAGRSGTSVTTRVVNLLGVPLGPQDDLHRGPGNPDGHFESDSLVAANDRLLERVGRHWQAPPSSHRVWKDVAATGVFRRYLLARFRRIYPSPPWLWKDPRLCLTLPVWRSVVPELPVLVFVHRHPVAVAASRHRGADHSERHGLASWERYNRMALVAAAGQPVVPVCYEHLVREPRPTVRWLGDRLRELGVAVGEEHDRAAASVRQRDIAEPDLGGHVSERMARLFETLRGLEPAPAFGPPELGPETTWVEPLFLEVLRRRASYPVRSWVKRRLRRVSERSWG